MRIEIVSQAGVQLIHGAQRIDAPLETLIERKPARRIAGLRILSEDVAASNNKERHAVKGSIHTWNPLSRSFNRPRRESRFPFVNKALQELQFERLRLCSWA